METDLGWLWLPSAGQKHSECLMKEHCWRDLHPLLCTVLSLFSRVTDLLSLQWLHGPGPLSPHLHLFSLRWEVHGRNKNQEWMWNRIWGKGTGSGQGTRSYASCYSPQGISQKRISSIYLLIVDIDQVFTAKQFLPQRSQGASQSHTAYRITLILDKGSIILRQNEKRAGRNHCIYLKD